MGEKSRRPVRLPPPSSDPLVPEPHLRMRAIAVSSMFAFTAVVSSGFFVSCTTREELSPVRTSYSIIAEDDDSDEIRKKFAESGWKIGEDGKIVPAREKNKDMFSGKEFRGSDKEMGEKRARLSRKKIGGEKLEMPEYLSRQKEFGTKESKEGGKLARESLRDKFRLKERNQVADTKGKSWLEKLGLVDNKPARDSGKKYKTSKNRELTTAGREAVAPNPRKMSSGGGFYRDSDMSIDEVRKLVSPDAFMR